MIAKEIFMKDYDFFSWFSDWLTAPLPWSFECAMVMASSDVRSGQCWLGLPPLELDGNRTK